MTFTDCEVKMVPKMECSFHPDSLQMAPFLDEAPTGRHSGTLKRSRAQNVLSNGASWYQKAVQDGGFWEEHLMGPQDVCFPVCQCTAIHSVCIEDADN